MNPCSVLEYMMVGSDKFELRSHRRVFPLEAGESFLRRAVGLEAADQKR